MDRQCVEKLVCDEHRVLCWAVRDIRDGMMKLQVDVSFRRRERLRLDSAQGWTRFDQMDIDGTMRR